MTTSYSQMWNDIERLNRERILVNALAKAKERRKSRLVRRVSLNNKTIAVDQFTLTFRHHVRGTICRLFVNDNLLDVGVAWRNPIDEFNAETGELVSLRKVTANLAKSVKRAIFSAYFDFTKGETNVKTPQHPNKNSVAEEARPIEYLEDYEF